MIRKIIHIDMDAFFAAVEQRDNPKYKNKPIIVGGKPNSRGVVATCSYEARKYGIHSAMAASRAYKLCSKAIFIKPKINVYKEVSREIMDVFKRYSNKIETISLDEAFLDVTNSTLYKGSATLIAKAIKKEIKNKLRLTASAGVSYNKFLAKIASDYQKPNGLTVIPPKEGKSFVEKLKIRKFYGVGKVTEKKMHRLGIYTGYDLQKKNLTFLKNNFGKSAQYFYYAARGIDNRKVSNSHIRKSIGKEATFAKDIENPKIMLEILNTIAEKVFNLTKNKNLIAKTLTIKVKYFNFKLTTRQKTNINGYKSLAEINKNIAILLTKTNVQNIKVRLLGVTLSNLVTKNTFYNSLKV